MKIRAVPIPARATVVIAWTFVWVLAKTSESFAAAPKSQRESHGKKSKPVGALVPTLSFSIPRNVANNRDGICKIKNIKLTPAVFQLNVLVVCRGKVVSKLSRITTIVQCKVSAVTARELVRINL